MKSWPLVKQVGSSWLWAVPGAGGARYQEEPELERMMLEQAQANAQALADEYKALVDTYRVRVAELEAHNARMRAAIERYLALSSDCEYIDGEPDACPAPDGVPCHWCELRAAVRGASDAV